MRCHVRISLGRSGYAETYCYEPLDDKGFCARHGQQAFLKPDWLSDDRWQTLLSNLRRQTVSFGHRHNSGSDTPNGRT